MPLPLTVSCFSKVQIGFIFLVPAHPGSPGQRAVKRVCVCVCVLNIDDNNNNNNYDNVYGAIIVETMCTDYALLINLCWSCGLYIFCIILFSGDDPSSCAFSGLPLTVKDILLEFTHLWDIIEKIFMVSSVNELFEIVDSHTVIIFITHTVLSGSAVTRKVKPIWILLKQETVSGSGIGWATCKSAPRSRQITTPTPHHSVFYRPDALPAAQPTVSKHWRHFLSNYFYLRNTFYRQL